MKTFLAILLLPVLGFSQGTIPTTTSTNTVTNKSMSGVDNTFTNIPQSSVTGLVTALAAKAPALVLTSNTTAAITFNASGNSEVIYNSNSATLLTGTITLPTTTVTGQVVQYVSKGAVTTLTMSGGTIDIGTTLTALVANASVQFIATGTNGHFVRTQ